MKTRLLIIILMTATVLSGCVIATGIPSDEFDNDVRPTIGQELLDLDRAHEAGVITDSEFARAKSQILNDID